MSKEKSPLDGVVKFAGTPEWQGKLSDVLREHTLPACEAVGISPESLPGRIEQDVYALLFTAVLEDLMSRKPEGAENLTDAFIKRHGWKLGGTIRRQLVALRDSTLVLFEVTSIAGTTVNLRDVLSDGATRPLESPALAQALERGALIALRLLEVDGATIPSPGMLPFEAGLAEEAAAALAQTPTAAGIASFWLRKVLEEAASDPHAAAPGAADAAEAYGATE